MPEILLYVVAVAFLMLLVGGLFAGARRARRRERAARGPERRPESRRREAPRPSAGPVRPPAEARPTGEPTAPERAPSRATLRDRLGRSRRLLAGRISEALSGREEELWDDLEAALIQADVGVEAATRITEELRVKARERRARGPEELKGLLAAELVECFSPEPDRALTFAPDAGAGPTVWLVVGVNGTGKTTTIGKLARDLVQRGRTVALAAADTFRAAADEQLGVWAERAGATMVRQGPGADPGAVAFDAYQHARARGVDVLIVDTAGRLHTKTPLMDELAKVRRVIERQGQVHESLLVIDATAGQNGLVQARQFADAVGLTGVVLTKLDGTAKGGIAVAIEQTLGIPIKLVGLGEDIDDLEPFDPKTFVDALLA